MADETNIDELVDMDYVDYIIHRDVEAPAHRAKVNAKIENQRRKRLMTKRNPVCDMDIEIDIN